MNEGERDNKVKRSDNSKSYNLNLPENVSHIDRVFVNDHNETIDQNERKMNHLSIESKKDEIYNESNMSERNEAISRISNPIIDTSFDMIPSSVLDEALSGHEIKLNTDNHNNN